MYAYGKQDIARMEAKMIKPDCMQHTHLCTVFENCTYWVHWPVNMIQYVLYICGTDGTFS